MIDRTLRSEPVSPETVASIKGNRELSDAQTPPKSGRMWECGCEQAFGRWMLCQYHLGYEAAVSSQP